MSNVVLERGIERALEALCREVAGNRFYSFDQAYDRVKHHIADISGMPRRVVDAAWILLPEETQREIKGRVAIVLFKCRPKDPPAPEPSPPEQPSSSGPGWGVAAIAALVIAAKVL